MSFEMYPVGVGPQFEGERVRKKQMYVELAGPKAKGFELCLVKKLNEVKDMNVVIKGPDLPELKGAGNAFGILLEIAGKELEIDLEAVIERRIHDLTNFVNGFMHLNQRYTNWLRLSIKSYEKGLNSFNMFGEILIKLFKAEFNIIEKAQITFYTDEKAVEKPFDDAMKVYSTRDERVRGMTDEEVECFYACTLCASFAPKHGCAIVPNRMSLCGAINWFDARAAAKVDPKGPIFRIEKGECVDAFAGEYTGINEMIKNQSLGEIDRIYLYSGLDFPHTSCGCFEAIAFYIPEVEGYGVVDRDFKGISVNGLAFSTMANSTGGGQQVSGFNGISIEYMRSPRFFQYDGGWDRFVWMPAAIKARIIDFIPEDRREMIATENDAMEIDILKSFLESKKHPVMERWVEEEEEEEESLTEYGAMEGVPMGTQTFTVPGVGGGSGFRVIMNNVKIYADSVIIKKIGGKSKKSKK
ncbi:MAG: CO dehydrogenase/CO-methylating acetyl-CoA synthase complex subunit beta [Promethearchaeota archaeon]